MSADELKAEIAIEFDLLRHVANELEDLLQDVDGREPTVREKTAAAAFLAQFYSGIESILKRLNRFYRLEFPVGENWHLELFKRFCPPEHPPLPMLFDDALARQLGPFRRFRHVVHHGYGFQIEWDRIREGLEQVSSILSEVQERVTAHLSKL